MFTSGFCGLFIHTSPIIIFLQFNKRNSSTKSASTAEVKVFVLLCYYTLLAFISLGCYCALFWRIDGYLSSLQGYFICEFGGVPMNGSVCDRSGFQSAAFPALCTIGIGLVALFPVANLVYAIKIHEVKELLQSIKKKVITSSQENVSTILLENTSYNISTVL